MLVRVLLHVDSPPLERRFRRLVKGPNILVTESPSSQILWQALAHDPQDLVFVSRSLLPEPAEDTVITIRRLPDRPEVVVVQHEDDPEDRAKLLTAGCLSVVSESLTDPILGDALKALIRRRREAAEVRMRAQSRRQYRLADFASESPAVRPLLDLAQRVAASDSSLIILGETGVGKEWLAHAIHTEGPRAAAPFIAVNCAAVPDSLLESELFGHERGAFTDANRSRRGYFELAHRGTIFLDEIADTTPHLQAKLLRAVQERTIYRIGAEQPISVDVRVMAATNRDLEEAMAAHAFRKDLYYRLATVSLVIPPLRERREDIAPLAASYLDQFARQLGRPIAGLDDDVLDALRDYSWPGNVRELINAMERAVLLCRGDKITLEDLPEALRPQVRPDGPAASAGGFVPPGSDWLDRPLREVREQAIARIERSYLEHQLERTHGRIGETAARAGITPRALHDKLKRCGLRKEDYKAKDRGR